MAQGAFPASRFLIASARAWVSLPLLTWSSSVWPIAFCTAALRLAELVLRSAERWLTKEEQRADVVVDGSASATVPKRGDRLRPAAEAVIQSVPAAMATTAAATPAVRSG